MIKNIYLRLLIITLSALSLNAKESNIDLIGRTEFGLNSHITNFKEFPEYPICCTQFLGNSAFAFEVDLGAKFKFKKTLFGSPLSFSTMLGFRNVSVKLSEDKQVGYRIYDNSYQPLISNFTIDNSIYLLNFKNRLTLENLFADNFSFDLGLDLGLPITKSFTQAETAVSPNDFNFENGKRVRNEVSGDIPNISSIMIAPAIGAKYLAYKDGNLSIMPLVNISYQVNSMVSGLNWNLLSAHVGAEFGLNLSTKDELPPPPPPPIPVELPKVKEPEVVKPDTIIISGTIYSNGKVANNSNPIAIRKEVTNYYSTFELIPVLFYAENQSTPLGIEKSTDKSIENIGALQIINSVIDYAKANPNDKITARLVSHNGEDENINNARYEWLNNYMKQQGANINIAFAKETKKISSSDRDEIKQDNQRLDFLINGKRKNISTSWFLKEEVAMVYPKVEFKVSSNCTASPCNNLIQAQSSNGILDQTVGNEFTLTNESLATLKNDSQLSFVVQATDSKGNNKANTFTSKVEVKTEIVKENYVTSYQTNSGYNDYLLGFCEFEKAEIYDVNDKVLEFVSKEIESGKKVVLIPMTDNIGTEEFNAQLKKQRAKSAMKYLKQSADLEVDYTAQSGIDNDNPYRRLLNRSVVIRVFENK